MKKKNLWLIAIALIFTLVFIGCDESGGDSGSSSPDKAKLPKGWSGLNDLSATSTDNSISFSFTPASSESTTIEHTLYYIEGSYLTAKKIREFSDTSEFHTFTEENSKLTGTISGLDPNTAYSLVVLAEDSDDFEINGTSNVVVIKTKALAANMLTITDVPGGTTILGAGVTNDSKETVAVAMATGSAGTRIFTFYIPSTGSYMPSSKPWTGSGEYYLSLSGDMTGTVQYLYTNGGDSPVKYNFPGGSSTLDWSKFKKSGESKGDDEVKSYKAGDMATALKTTIEPGAKLDDLIGAIMPDIPGLNYAMLQGMNIKFYKDEDMTQEFSGTDTITDDTMIYTTTDLSTYLSGDAATDPEGTVITITGTLPAGIIAVAIIDSATQQPVAVGVSMDGSGVFELFTPELTGMPSQTPWTGNGSYMISVSSISMPDMTPTAIGIYIKDSNPSYTFSSDELEIELDWSTDFIDPALMGGG